MDPSLASLDSASAEALQALGAQVAELAGRLDTIEEQNGGAFAPINNFYITPEGGTAQTGGEGGEGPLEKDLAEPGKEEPAEEPAATPLEASEVIKWLKTLRKVLKAKGKKPKALAESLAALVEARHVVIEVVKEVKFEVGFPTFRWEEKNVKPGGLDSTGTFKIVSIHDQTGAALPGPLTEEELEKAVGSVGYTNFAIGGTQFPSFYIPIGGVFGLIFRVTGAGFSEVGRDFPVNLAIA